jgi:hypothetical protein
MTKADLVSKTSYKIQIRTMYNAQNMNVVINIPSSRTFRSYLWIQMVYLERQQLLLYTYRIYCIQPAYKSTKWGCSGPKSETFDTGNETWTCSLGLYISWEKENSVACWWGSENFLHKNDQEFPISVGSWNVASRIGSGVWCLAWRNDGMPEIQIRKSLHSI